MFLVCEEGVWLENKEENKRKGGEIESPTKSVVQPSRKGATICGDAGRQECFSGPKRTCSTSILQDSLSLPLSLKSDL